MKKVVKYRNTTGEESYHRSECPEGKLFRIEQSTPSRHSECNNNFMPEESQHIKRFLAHTQNDVGCVPSLLFAGRRKTAFTLAEVLITLGIIGVVAAMTLPALVQNYQGAVLNTQLQKAYSILSQALQKMQYDYQMVPNNANFGALQGTNETGGGLFMDAFRPYFLSFGNCKTRSCVPALSEDENGNKVVKTDRYKNYNGTSDINTTLLDDGQMIMADTMLLFVENYRSRILLTIDVNGINKRPNRWGHDLFTFAIDEKTGKLLPMGSPNTPYTSNTYCSMSSTGNINGIACTYRALTEKDYFKNLPK